MNPPVMTFSKEAWEELRRQAQAAYPFEGCGLLLGPFEKRKKATKIVVLKNTLRDVGRGRFDFQFSSQEFAEKQLAADRENLDVVGIFHTHPDHPPTPSKTDESQPMLSGWISVIASVHGGKFKEAKAWWREEDVQSFQESELVLET